jgi:hypothetical protein
MRKKKEEQLCIILARKRTNVYSLVHSLLQSHFSTECDLVLLLSISSTLYFALRCGDSSVSIAIGYGLDSPAIETRWWSKFFAHIQTGPRAHPASCTICTGSFWGVSGWSMVLTTHPLLAPRSRKSGAIPLPCLSLQVFYGVPLPSVCIMAVQ